MRFSSIGRFIEALEDYPLWDDNGDYKYFLRDGFTIIEEDLRTGETQQLKTRDEIIKRFDLNIFSHHPKIEDKTLVFAWRFSEPFAREVRFYDSELSMVCNKFDGSSRGGSFDCYEPIPVNPETGKYDAPYEWANKMVEKLKR